jgi:hypothetical protein
MGSLACSSVTEIANRREGHEAGPFIADVTK